MRAYTPRRCSARYLDGDCPADVLAIIDHGHGEPAERYDVFYTYVSTVANEDWMTYYAVSESGSGYHGDMRAHEVAAYRYRMKHRYTAWSTLPDAAKRAVRRDIQLATEEMNA